MVMTSLFLHSQLKFAVAHCNFQLRGEDSDKDETLVTEWCLSNNIPFHSVRFDTGKYVAEWKMGIQEAARKLRYEWLEGVRQANAYEKIATAHHANDNIETFLMNLFKGTGISGLHGIPEVNGHIIRPLLFAEKSMIVAYAADHGVPYRDDASNATDKYLRNAVRHHVLPKIQEWFPNVVPGLKESIVRFSQAEQLYQKAIAIEKKKLLEKRGQDYYVPILKLQKCTPLETISYELFAPFGFTPAQVPGILNLLSSESGHYIASATHRVIRNRDFLVITVLATTETDFIVIDKIPAQITIGTKQCSFSLIEKPGSITTDSNIALVDAANAPLPLILRKWKTGDYFYPIGMNMKKKKLSKFFIDQKIPLHEKENIWVLECNKKIIWVAGLRLDERFKIKPKTTQVIKIAIH